MSITNLGTARARDRADLVRRNRAGARRGRRRASGLLQAVRADGVRRRAPARCWPRGGRARAADAQVWAAHLAVVEGESAGDVQFETDRARFLGRGRAIRTPISVIDGRPLSNTVGTVLDPIFSLRRRVRIPPGATARIAFWTLVAPLAPRRSISPTSITTPTAFERAVTLAWTQAQVQLHHLGVGPDEAHLFQRLANRVLYSDPTLRPSSDVLEAKRGRPRDALGPWHLRRPADRAGSHRRSRGSGNRSRSWCAPTNTGG